MKNPRIVNLRNQAIRRLEAALHRNAYPRVEMAILVSLTGGMGLLASFFLLELGLNSMALRYPLALAIAYLFFLMLVWVWLRLKARDFVDMVDLTGLLPQRASTGFRSGNGGDFAGGGASSSFDTPTDLVSETTDLSSPRAGAALDDITDTDEFALPLIVIFMALGLALAALYVIYIAPVLFAEVLVDGALSYALLRHLRSADGPLWLRNLVRRTAPAFALTAIFLAGVGYAMGVYAPNAKSIGQVIEHVSKRALPVQ